MDCDHTLSDQPNNLDPRQNEPLPYRSVVDERRERGLPIGVQAFLSFIATGVIICGGGLFAAIVTNSSSGGLAVVILACIGLAGAAAYIHTKAHVKYRGWAIGIWLGIGIVGLLDGICFVAVS